MINLTRGLPNPDNEYSIAGTAAHKVGQLCLENGQEPIEYVGRKVMAKGILFEITSEMAEAVALYVDLCSRLKADAGPIWGVEARINLAPLNPPRPMFGTADFWCIVNGVLYVVDYKHGFVGVPIEGNQQAPYYALGVLLGLPKRTRIDRVHLMIVQPNAFGKDVKEIQWSVDELLFWSLELIEKAEATTKPDAPLTAGSWCKDARCKAAGRCPAQLAYAQAIVTDGGQLIDQTLDERLLDPVMVDGLLGLLPTVKGWIKSVEEAADRFAAADLLPSWKQVPTNGVERWRNPAEAGELLTGTTDLTEAEAYEPRVVVSPAQARMKLARRILVDRLEMWGQTVGAKRPTKKDAEQAAREELQAFIEKRSGGVKLVPRSHPTPAITNDDQLGAIED